MQNWAEDLYFRELDLDYPGVIDAMVRNWHSSPIISWTLPQFISWTSSFYGLVIDTNWSYFGASWRCEYVRWAAELVRFHFAFLVFAAVSLLKTFILGRKMTKSKLGTYPLSLHQVHRGFYAAYHNTTLRERVVGAVQDILQARSDLGVMITGHSMGGAMATFCALGLSVSLLKFMRGHWVFLKLAIM